MVYLCIMRTVRGLIMLFMQAPLVLHKLAIRFRQ